MQLRGGESPGGSWLGSSGSEWHLPYRLGPNPSSSWTRWIPNHPPPPCRAQWFDPPVPVSCNDIGDQQEEPQSTAGQGSGVGIPHGLSGAHTSWSTGRSGCVVMRPLWETCKWQDCPMGNAGTGWRNRKPGRGDSLGAVDWLGFFHIGGWKEMYSKFYFNCSLITLSLVCDSSGVIMNSSGVETDVFHKAHFPHDLIQTGSEGKTPMGTQPAIKTSLPHTGKESRWCIWVKSANLFNTNSDKSFLIGRISQ